MKTRSGKRFISNGKSKSSRVKIMVSKKRTARSKSDSESIQEDKDVSAAETNPISIPVTRKMRNSIRDLKEEFNLKLREKENQISALTNRLNEALQKIQSDRRKIQDLLSCDICWELLQEPYMSPACGHTFCLQCIGSWNLAPSHAESSLPRPPTQCPTCRNVEFGCCIKNYVVLSLVEALIDNDDS